MLYSLKCTNKNDGKILCQYLANTKCDLSRQQDMQRQVEKLTDLVRLIVQKMEIPAKIEMDDTSSNEKNDVQMRLKKLRQTFSAVHRLQKFQSLSPDPFSSPTSCNKI